MGRARPPPVQAAQNDHPEWFDPVLYRDTNSWLVLDANAAAYVSNVASCTSGGGRVVVVDANAPGNEIRVRGDTDSLAENYIVRTYQTRRTSARYTSTCTPAYF
jgi:hypothetical protein